MKINEFTIFIDFWPIAFVNKILLKWVTFDQSQKNGRWCRVYEVKMKVVGNLLYFFNLLVSVDINS